MTLDRRRMFWVLSGLFVACADVGEVEPGGAPAEPTAEVQAQVNPAWVEALAPSTDPCASAPLASCEAATRGACGVIEIDAGAQCLPRFAWGVLPDGEVELASTARRFTIAALERAPLTPAEEQEARELADEIAAAEPAAASEDPGLISIDHGSSWCNGSTHCYNAAPFKEYYVYRSHYNYKDGYGIWRHRHQHYQYLLGTTCARTGVWGYAYADCGTP